MEILTKETAVKYEAQRKAKGKLWVVAILAFIMSNAKAIKEACAKNENLGVILSAEEIAKAEGKELKGMTFIAGGSVSVSRANEQSDDFILSTIHEKRENKKGDEVNKAVAIRVILNA